MLRHTFCHLPGIGPRTERRLWEAGCTSWEAALAPGPMWPAPLARLPSDPLRDSLSHYQGRNPAWFGQRLPAAQSWRLYHDFRDSCATTSTASTWATSCAT